MDSQLKKYVISFDYTDGQGNKKELIRSFNNINRAYEHHCEIRRLEEAGRIREISNYECINFERIPNSR